MGSVHSLLARACLEDTPIVDGPTITFVWEGRTAPLLLGDFTDWERGDPLTLVRQAPGVWTYTGLIHLFGVE
jgi:hypothetical protein